ncbi:MAG: hypothetical protein KGI73_03745 [Patescibacteria group bacterium]|nr:hypothetical protein [Patescibacteria group bacterium]
MDSDLIDALARIAAIEQKVDHIYVSVEKTRKYFFWTGVVTLVVIVVPLLLFPLVIPLFLQSLSLPAGF